MSRRFQGRTCPSQQGLAVVCINQLLARPSCNLNDDDGHDDGDDDDDGGDDDVDLLQLHLPTAFLANK